jgi:hypothetical protein
MLAHPSASVSIRQNFSTAVSGIAAVQYACASVSICQHPPASVSIRQHTGHMLAYAVSSIAAVQYADVC